MKTVKRILSGLLGLAIGLVILLAGSIAIDFAVGAERINAVTNTTIPGQNGGPDVRVYVATPAGEGPFPVVIMIHEFYGLNESIVGKAEGLAQEGYLVVAPDTFAAEPTAWIPRAIYQVVTNKPEQVNQDLELGVCLDRSSAQRGSGSGWDYRVLLWRPRLIELQLAQ